MMHIHVHMYVQIPLVLPLDIVTDSHRYSKKRKINSFSEVGKKIKKNKNAVLTYTKNMQALM